MEALHVFIKGRNGNGVFYRTEDFLVLISIVGTIAREMGISIIAFCPMFNHVHILVKGIDMEFLLQDKIRLGAVRIIILFGQQLDVLSGLLQKIYRPLG